jgi:hypothetical protein
VWVHGRLLNLGVAANVLVMPLWRQYSLKGGRGLAVDEANHESPSRKYLRCSGDSCAGIEGTLLLSFRLCDLHCIGRSQPTSLFISRMLVWPCFLFPTTVLEVLGFQNKASVHFFFI